MRVRQERFDVRTNGKGTYEITDDIQSIIDKTGVRAGTMTAFVQHTSCSLIVMENADPDYFTHGSEGSDDMPSHIRMTLTRTSETVPIVDGKMHLGTWQGIFLFEHRCAAHRRKIFVTIIGE